MKEVYDAAHPRADVPTIPHPARQRPRRAVLPRKARYYVWRHAGKEEARGPLGRGFLRFRFGSYRLLDEPDVERIPVRVALVGLNAPMMPKMIVQIHAPKIRINPIRKHAVAPPMTQAISMTSWKLSDSLPWSSTNGLVSFLISQMISGPRKPRKIDRQVREHPHHLRVLVGSGPTYGPG